MRTILFYLLLLVTSHSWAVSKNDFANGYTLEVDGDGAIYSLYLNEDIYAGLTRMDRADIRIFNSQGVAVPHYLRRNEQFIRTTQTNEDRQPPIYPLYRDNQTNTAAGYNIHITTNDQGAIIDVNYGKHDMQNRELAGYLIDTSDLEQTPNRMFLNWNESNSDFILPVQIEASDDLTNWRTLVNRATISHLQYGAHTLEQNEIELPIRKSKYLRLTWLGKPGLALENIVLRFADIQLTEEQPRQWSNILFHNWNEKEHTFYYDSGHVFPVDRIAVELPQRNMLMKVRIESADTEKGPWVMRYQGLLYDLQQSGEHLTNPIIHPVLNSHRHWRIVLLEDATQRVEAPILRLGWIPEQLLFVAQGEAPFTLAYGSARVGSFSSHLAQLMNNQNSQQQGRLVKPARLGSRIQLGDASVLEKPRPPVDWKRYILWSILVIGVLLLAVMVLRLYKQMDQSDASK